MKETHFVRQNKEKWLQSEQFIKGNENDPEKLSALFVQVVDDLSYSQTYYKHRSVRVYLNTLAREFFSIISNARKEKQNRFKAFWLEELPQVVIFCRRELLISLIVFLLAVGIGVFSSANDKDFTATILGDGYVDMTIENIKKGDPMAVYKDMNQVEMFLKITYNNLMVAVRTYVFGIFMSLGTIMILLYNGIMVGSFQYFFAQHNLLATSAMTIWLHGTIEISSIIIAGGAGLTLGSGLLFPGTYSRLQAFQMSAMRSFKLMLGIAPFIVVAGVIESFITRYTEVPAFIKVLLIILSAACMIGYFVVYPWWKSKTGFAHSMREARLQPNTQQPINFLKIKNSAEVLGDAFAFYKRNLRLFFSWIIPVTLIATIVYFFTHTDQPQRVQFNLSSYYLSEMFFALGMTAFPKVLLMTVTSAIITTLVAQALLKEAGQIFTTTNRLTGFIICLLSFGVVYFGLYASANWGYWIFALSFGLIMFMLFGFLHRGTTGETFSLLTSGFGAIMGMQVILFFTLAVFLLLLTSPILYLYSQIITWNFVQNESWVNDLVFIFETFLKLLAFNLLIPIVVTCMGLMYYSLIEVTSASALKRAIAGIQLKHVKREA